VSIKIFKGRVFLMKEADKSPIKDFGDRLFRVKIFDKV